VPDSEVLLPEERKKYIDDMIDHAVSKGVSFRETRAQRQTVSDLEFAAFRPVFPNGVFFKTATATPS
jgi:hypothetical protein